MMFDDYAKGINEIPKTITAPQVVKTELTAVLDKVKDNTELKKTVDEIKGDQS